MSYSSAYDAHLDNYGDPAPYGADDERPLSEEELNEGSERLYVRADDGLELPEIIATSPDEAKDEYAVPEGLVESERVARAEASRMGRLPRNPIYKTGPITGAGSMSVNGYYGYHNSGLRTAVYIARKNSKRDSLVHVVARKVADDRDTPVCGFEGGVEVPIDDVRRVIVNGYGG